MHSRSTDDILGLIFLATVFWAGGIGTAAAHPVYLDNVSLVYRLGSAAYTGTGFQPIPGANDDFFAVGTEGRYTQEDIGAIAESSFTLDTAALFDNYSSTIRLTTTANSFATFAPGEYIEFPYVYAFAQPWFASITFSVEQDSIYSGPFLLGRHASSADPFGAGDILTPGLYSLLDYSALNNLLPSVGTGWLDPGQSASLSRTSIVDFSFTAVPVPTPQTALLLISGFMMLWMARFRRRS